ncbi:core histone macro-H2A.1-like [Penaeus monodon]|uniref:core histone macro-H2A.1-like n=1 Tax=Penaeus monodon TaxID=6687 RepID=UPI0018A74A65|nr:core histone macro-H2A.1-like [Penaeus monodon]
MSILRFPGQILGVVRGHSTFLTLGGGDGSASPLKLRAKGKDISSVLPPRTFKPVLSEKKLFLPKVRDLANCNGPLPACDVAICSGFKLPSRWVIHVNGPTLGDVDAFDKLERCVKNCLVLADKQNLKSLALPSIGSGKAGFPKQQAAQTIIKSICSYFVNVMSSSLKQIYFVLYDMESIGAYTAELAKLDS